MIEFQICIKLNYNRKGFDDWWDNIGEDIEEEIENGIYPKK